MIKNGIKIIKIDCSAKFFIWKKWQSPGLKNLIELAAEQLALENSESLRLYDSRGMLITDEAQIFDGMIYELAATERYEKINDCFR